MGSRLAYGPIPAGYGDSVLPLETCKAHLRVDGDDEDDLISALRDAAIDFVERYVETKLLLTGGQEWRSDALPLSAQRSIDIGLRPIGEIEAVEWQDASGVRVTGGAGFVRVDGAGDLRLALGASSPVGVAGNVVVRFSAGYPAGEAPPMLLQAVRLMLGHLYMNREAVIVGAVNSEAPLGVTALCMPFRRMRI